MKHLYLDEESLTFYPLYIKKPYTTRATTKNINVDNTSLKAVTIGPEATAGSIDGKCRPIFSVNVPDNSRGISLYLLDANKVKSKYGIHVEIPGVWWDKINDLQYSTLCSIMYIFILFKYHY